MTEQIADSLCELIGGTPLVRLSRFGKDLPGEIVGKLEMRNPLASVKDRIGLAMIEQAEEDGLIQPGGTIIEPTSGNTGIALAWVARVKGYRLILTMPDTMSAERRRILTILGAELVLTPGKEGMQGPSTGRGSCSRRSPARSSRISSTIRPIRRSITARPVPRSGAIPAARSITWWPAWAPAARSPARGAT